MSQVCQPPREERRDHGSGPTSRCAVPAYDVKPEAEKPSSRGRVRRELQCLEFEIEVAVQRLIFHCVCKFARL